MTNENRYAAGTDIFVMDKSYYARSDNPLKSRESTFTLVIANRNTNSEDSVQSSALISRD